MFCYGGRRHFILILHHKHLITKEGSCFLYFRAMLKYNRVSFLRKFYLVYFLSRNKSIYGYTMGIFFAQILLLITEPWKEYDGWNVKVAWICNKYSCVKNPKIYCISSSFKILNHNQKTKRLGIHWKIAPSISKTPYVCNYGSLIWSYSWWC